MTSIEYECMIVSLSVLSKEDIINLHIYNIPQRMIIVTDEQHRRVNYLILTSKHEPSKYHQLLKAKRHLIKAKASLIALRNSLASHNPSALLLNAIKDYDVFISLLSAVFPSTAYDIKDLLVGTLAQHFDHVSSLKLGRPVTCLLTVKHDD